MILSVKAVCVYVYIQGVVFIDSPNTAALSHRKPAPAGASRDNCRAWGGGLQIKKHSVVTSMLQNYRIPCAVEEISAFFSSYTERERERERERDPES